jgi:hypothetical protein
MDAHQGRMMAVLERRRPRIWRQIQRKCESGAEHREVPKEHAAVETGTAPNKRYGSRNLVEKRRGQPEERIKVNYGSRMKLTVAERRHAVQKWHSARETSSTKLRREKRPYAELQQDRRSEGGISRK